MAVKWRFLLGGTLVLCMLWACSSVPGYRGPVSENFDGERFRNLAPEYREKSLGDLLRWVFNREREEQWRWLPLEAGPALPPARVREGLTVTFINHATVLVQVDGINILTDPIWSHRTSPVSWLGPQRYHDPGVRFEDLPPIDYVVISHNHYDHMDLPSLQRLWERDQPTVVAGLGNRKLLAGAGIEKVVELDWWQPLAVNGQLTIHGVPAQHWSTRTRLDTNRTLWMGYVFASSEGPILFAGDTGLGPHFALINERFGPMQLSLLPIGAYLPRWFMRDNHLSPADALEAHRILQSRQSMAIHFGTFPLGDDGQTATVARMLEVRDRAGLAAEVFWVPVPGGIYGVGAQLVSLHASYR
ncbi:hypothetical protein FKG94_10665 [Exilibacterium tricleocarpae]|uniref:Metallo-beta-lactamase domain-containing protein n=1 Tax=Exilibacterium tricleocarpae TaxID=2591008 RepID=A0A545TSD0_9GAMM|nr:MBL fold metallo-hydrolase [Exilibacterium tricleocarpae]TQV80122.1 hypothetical protein FKG94_10665 [Exilibacterium tricleocarpae]